MAGIGFELKKLYRKRGLFFGARALFYSSFTIIGPQLMILCLLTAFRALLGTLDLGYGDYNLFMASVLYPLLFSQVVTSGFVMMLTRYTADSLYTHKLENILPSLYGAVGICLPVGAAAAVLFLWPSPVAFWTKAATYLIFLLSICMWLQMVYLSALRDYRKIALSFLVGMSAAILCGCLLIRFTRAAPVTALLYTFAGGLLLINGAMFFFIRGFFRDTGQGEKAGYFAFLKGFRFYPQLFFIGLFYTLSLYVHNFLFWGSGLQSVVWHTYYIANAYDTPTFFAFLSILPTCVLFPVHMETEFYGAYRQYYTQITQGGNYSEIASARKGMTATLWQELFHVMELQLFISVFYIVLGNYVLPYFGLTGSMVNTFASLTMGAYCSISMYLAVLLDLYFENRRGALLSVTVFLAANVILTVCSLQMGEDYYGTGYLAASFLALSVSLLNLDRFLRRIDFITFCSQPPFVTRQEGGR